MPAFTVSVYPAGGHEPITTSAEILFVIYAAATLKQGNAKHGSNDRVLFILMRMEIQLRLSRQIGLD